MLRFSRVQSKCRGTEVQRWSRAGAGAGCRVQDAGADIQTCRGEVDLQLQVQRCRGAEVQRCRGAEMMEMLSTC